MFVVYIVTVFLVTALLLSIPLFPFCKVAKLVRDGHPDVWNSKGPFSWVGVLSSSAQLGNFIDMVEGLAADKTLAQKDDMLARWSRVASSVYALRPKTFAAQVGYFLVFFYFTGVITSLIL